MDRSNRTPIFNLKAVVLETGIKPDTLRAWERRYGIPAPQRAESGHRLFTRRDIDTLKWLLQRQEEGLSISRAVALWQKLEKEQGDPLQELPLIGGGDGEHIESAGSQTGARTRNSTHYDALARGLTSRGEDAQLDERNGEKLHSLRAQWIAAVLAFDEHAADTTLTTAFGLFSPEVVCIELIQKSLSIIGDGWYEGRVTVQQEHFASALAIRRLDSMLAATPPPTRPGRILVGCPPEEAHTFVPLMLSLFLRRKGWNVIYLAADIPLQSLELTINTTRPDLVLLSAQQLHTVVGLLDMAQVFAESHIPLGYGGLIFNRFPDLQKIIPGYFMGRELAQAVEAVEEIMAGPRPKAAEEAINPIYGKALAQFQERRARIEAELWKRLEDGKLPQRLLGTGNANFARSIQAALALGNMNYLGPDMEWVQGLLHNHYRMPRYMVGDYIAAYRDAARLHLNETAKPLLDWLDKLVHEAEQSHHQRSSSQIRDNARTSNSRVSSDDPTTQDSLGSITDSRDADRHNS